MARDFGICLHCSLSCRVVDLRDAVVLFGEQETPLCQEHFEEAMIEVRRNIARAMEMTRGPSPSD